VAWIDGIEMYIIGSAVRVPLVTRYIDALNGFSVGVKMLGLESVALSDNVIESAVGLRNSR
jgi:hypothetical protein